MVVDLYCPVCGQRSGSIVKACARCCVNNLKPITMDQSGGTIVPISFDDTDAGRRIIRLHHFAPPAIHTRSLLERIIDYIIAALWMILVISSAICVALLLWQAR